MTKSTITREQAQQIIDAADEVITALAGTNDEVHKDDTNKMVRLWDDLNDRYAPPEVVRELARMGLAAIDSEPVAEIRAYYPLGIDGGKQKFVQVTGELPDFGAQLYTIQQPAPEREHVRREHAEWSQATFGNVGPVGPLKHLAKEAMEAAAEPDDLSEWADMQFLLWDAQRRAGITDEQITQAMIEKLAVNKQREWPEPKDGEPRLHIKDQPSAVGPVTDAMAYAFHHALTDGPLGDDDVEDIKIGLRAAFANVTTYQPLPVVLKEHQIRELVNKLRDIAIEYHGTRQLRERIACVIRTAMSAVAPPAPKSAVI
jgi:hypothetical protein